MIRMINLNYFYAYKARSKPKKDCDKQYLYENKQKQIKKIRD